MVSCGKRQTLLIILFIYCISISISIAIVNFVVVVRIKLSVHSIHLPISYLNVGFSDLPDEFQKLVYVVRTIGAQQFVVLRQDINALRVVVLLWNLVY